MHQKKIIGGEYIIKINSKNKVENIEFAPFGRLYASGRSALYVILRYIKEHFGTRRVLLPDYICTSVTQTIMDVEMNYSFYHINMDFKPDMSSICNWLSYTDTILLVNYFGMVDLATVITKIRAVSSGIKIIVDDVQNFYGFRKKLDYDFAFTSYRKWFPVPDGAEILTKDESILLELEELEEQNLFAQYKFAGNILKNYRGIVTDGLCLELLEKGEKILNKEYRCSCSEISSLLMQQINFSDAAKARCRNAEYLHERLNELGITHLYRKGAVPLFVPIILQNSRDQVRKALFRKQIFCPVHWPCVNRTYNGTNCLYAEELSLICDQRYDLDDMNFILGILEHEVRD